MKILGLQIPFTKLEDVSVNRPVNADIRKRITSPTQLYRSRQDIATWRAAVTAAESIHNPQRYMLYKCYNDMVLDAHLTAAINQRKSLTLSKEFEVELNDEESEEYEYIVKQKWFYDFVNYALDSNFYGYSLIQFDSVIDNVFKAVELVPREYVKPEFHIVTNNYSVNYGTDYLENPYRNWCIGVGEPRDLGLIMKAAPLVIWKKNAMGAWSEFAEVFGTPLRIGKTNVRDEETRANMENMLKNMGVAAYGVFDTDDLIELIESNRSDAHQVYNEMISRCNSEISKLILGQTSTLDEKSFVGSAEVHERILDNIGFQDEIFIENVINTQLVPMMQRLGLLPEGIRINVKSEDNMTLEQQINVDMELLRSGKYKFTPEYLKEKYGTEVIEINEVGSVQDIKNRLDNLYK